MNTRKKKKAQKTFPNSKYSDTYKRHQSKRLKFTHLIDYIYIETHKR